MCLAGFAHLYSRTLQPVRLGTAARERKEDGRKPDPREQLPAQYTMMDWVATDTTPHTACAGADLVCVEPFALILRVAELAVCPFAKAATHAHTSEFLDLLAALQELRFLVKFALALGTLLVI